MPQSLSKLYVHLVFSTKRRADTIPKSHLAEVHAYIAEIFNNHGCPAVQVGGTTNHVHILFLLGKQTNLADIVRKVKSSSSRWINEVYGNPFHHFDWQDGYGAFSVGYRHVDAVMAYIKGQEEHHRKATFQDEFRRVCELYNVPLDERYAWD
ncbi:MAG: IS200/IS605 family transposase [Paludibacteraceae bacterium]|nr:IS200/IS605 family transposase [Paludibacteraceae bacterium]